jgi:hypothetical protein
MLLKIDFLIPPIVLKLLTSLFPSLQAVGKHKNEAPYHVEPEVLASNGNVGPFTDIWSAE